MRSAETRRARRDRHIIFSVTKSFTGLLAEMLIEEGLLDDQQLVSDNASDPPTLIAGTGGSSRRRQRLDRTRP